MKKTIVLFALLVTVMVSAQDKITEGIIISKQSMSSDNEQIKARLESMGDIESTTYFKDNKSRTEFSNPMSGDVVTIADSKTKETLTLMSNPMLGKKYMLQKAENLDDKNDEVVLGDKTKTILGYICKQYFVKIEKDGVKMDMELYATDSIMGSSPQTAALGDKLKGYPLYMILNMSQMGGNIKMTIEATEIKKEVISDDKFNMVPPEGYEKMQG